MIDQAARPPFEGEALRLAKRHAGRAPAAVRRFTTGATHFVYEALFSDLPALVVRITRPEWRATCRDAARLSRRLRPLGVPLPALLEDGSDAPVPYLVLERLEGTDLWAVINGLPHAALRDIAGRIAEAQAIVAATDSAGRYGYAAEPSQAPHGCWSAVVEANVQRSRERIAAAGLVDPAIVERLARLVAAARGGLDAVPSRPFLHDTSTKNVIVTPDGRFSGIVDVDDLCFGDPAYAAALTLTAILCRAGPATYVEAWLARAGRAMDRLFWLYVAVFAVDFLAEQGQDFNGNQPPSSPDERARLAALFEDAAARSGQAAG